MAKSIRKTSNKRSTQPAGAPSGPAGSEQAVREKTKAKSLDKTSIPVHRGNMKAVNIDIPEDLLAEIDGQIPSPAHRESFILAAIRHRLHPTPDRKITKAISQSTSTSKTGRYEE
jgi:hypothetical protein